ncbi:hypothetical protein PV326_001426 [Microctonus aethiopoides]|nr:hypothetical protein PV326_001426 [Microctonus aethiopoides]
MSVLLDCELNDGWLLFQWIKSHRVWCNCTRIVDKCHIITVHIATSIFLDKINWWQQTATRRRPQRGLHVDSQRPLRRHYSRKPNYQRESSSFCLPFYDWPAVADVGASSALFSTILSTPCTQFYTHTQCIPSPSKFTQVQFVHHPNKINPK